jgi:hypothetical protein
VWRWRWRWFHVPRSTVHRVPPVVVVVVAVAVVAVALRPQASGARPAAGRGARGGEAEVGPCTRDQGPGIWYTGRAMANLANPGGLW